MRLDLYLFKYGFTESRQKAQNLIESGSISVDGKVCTKPSTDIQSQDVAITGRTMPYVGRGGLKLEGALNTFNVSPEGKTAIDLGASTGGFTDCLLKRGAIKVYAVDSGTNQLHSSLRSDSRVVSIENFNARELSPEIIPEKCNFAVCDLSFISQKHIYVPLISVLEDGAEFISLIKPQFEVGREHISKNGIVKDKKAHEAAISSILEAAAAEFLYCHSLARSCITGGDGNIEYVAYFKYKDFNNIDPAIINKTVYGD